ncbi:MAG: hypothetical protein QXL31_06735 [Thermosphaera sp.]
MCYEFNLGGAVSFAMASAALGWSVGAILRCIPGLSRATREGAAYMMDYALACMVFIAILGGGGAAFKSFIDSTLESLMGGQWKHYCFAVRDFYANSLAKALGVVGALSVLVGGLAFVPAVGTALSIGASILVAPILIMLGLIIIPMSAVNFVTTALMMKAGGPLFTAGVAAICAPYRLLKGLGGVLLALALVFYVAMPYIPVAYTIIMENQALPEEFRGAASWESVFSSIDRMESQIKGAKIEAGVFETNLLDILYGGVVDWAVMCVLTGILLVIAFAAARGLAQSIGGVSASV